MQNWRKVGVHVKPTKVTSGGGSEFKGKVNEILTVLQKNHHVSLHDRPAGHGAIERFNRELCQNMGKMCLSGSKDKEWVWVAQIAADTNNASVHAPSMRGMYGITPSACNHAYGKNSACQNLRNCLSAPHQGLYST